jgi:ribonuclease E
VIRAIRDYFTADIGEILIDTDDIYEQAQQFMSHVMPDMAHRVKRYRDDVAAVLALPDRAPDRDRLLAHGATCPRAAPSSSTTPRRWSRSDVNSARATRGGDIEETATRTNLEAADEIARQLRLRDLGGLIVIDFIDMEESKQPAARSRQRLRDALRYDRARVQFGSISQASACSNCQPPAPAPGAVPRAATSPARAATAPATSATPRAPRCRSCASSRKRR